MQLWLFFMFMANNSSPHSKDTTQDFNYLFNSQFWPQYSFSFAFVFASSNAQEEIVHVYLFVWLSWVSLLDSSQTLVCSVLLKAYLYMGWAWLHCFPVCFNIRGKVIFTFHFCPLKCQLSCISMFPLHHFILEMSVIVFNTHLKVIVFLKITWCWRKLNQKGEVNSQYWCIFCPAVGWINEREFKGKKEALIYFDNKVLQALIVDTFLSVTPFSGLAVF